MREPQRTQRSPRGVALARKTGDNRPRIASQGLRRRKNRCEAAVSTVTERRSPMVATTLVTVLQPAAGKGVAYSKTWSAKLVAHAIWTDALPTREMFNQTAGTSVRLEIVTSQMCPPAQKLIPFHTTPPLVDVENLQSNRYCVPDG